MCIISGGLLERMNAEEELGNEGMKTRMALVPLMGQVRTFRPCQIVLGNESYECTVQQFTSSQAMNTLNLVNISDMKWRYRDSFWLNYMISKEVTHVNFENLEKLQGSCFPSWLPSWLSPYPGLWRWLKLMKKFVTLFSLASFVATVSKPRYNIIPNWWHIMCRGEALSSHQMLVTETTRLWISLSILCSQPFGFS